MAYNPYYPNYYPFPNNYPTTQLQQVANPPTNSNQGLIWVCGEAGAKSYLVAPNNTVLLMDSEQDRFFIKSADNAGMPTLRTFDYKEVGAQQPQQVQQNVVNEEYVTNKDFNALMAKYDDLEKKYEELKSALNKAPRKKVEVENE